MTTITRTTAAARTRVAVAHEAEPVTIPAEDVAVGDFLVRVPPFSAVTGPRARKVHHVRGTRFDSQVSGNALVPDGRGSGFIHLEVVSHRGTVWPLDPTVPVTVRRATEWVTV